MSDACTHVVQLFELLGAPVSGTPRARPALPRRTGAH